MTGAWDPQRDMHRGRITATRDAEGRLLYFTIAIGPNKTDADGTKDFHVHLPYSAEAEVNASLGHLVLWKVFVFVSGFAAGLVVCCWHGDTRNIWHGRRTHGR